MESQLKELLESIQRDGVKEAERRSGQIIADAEARAAEITQRAQKTAERSLQEAKRTVARWQQSAEKQVQQAGNNVVIAIRERVIAMFDAVLAREAQKTISAQRVGEIICQVVSEQIVATQQSRSATITGGSKDIIAIRDYLQQKMGKELVGSVSFVTHKTGAGGVVLNFDDEHSEYRLSLADICRSMQELLAPQLRRLLDGSVNTAGGSGDADTAGGDGTRKGARAAGNDDESADTAGGSENASAAGGDGTGNTIT